MMTAKVISREDGLEVSIAFSDSRLVDIEFALLSVIQTEGWEYERTDLDLDHVIYKVTSHGDFLALLHVTHGLEPPTRVLIQSKPPEGGSGRAHIGSTSRLAQDFLKECKDRGFATDRAVAGALADIERHAKAVA